RLALCWDLVPAVNTELKALAAAGADWIQIDEPSAAIVPGQLGEYVKMFNAAVEGVRAKIGYHVCFGNLLSRPRGKRSYRGMFPQLLECRCDQFLFEYANREMAEIDMWREVGVDREIACGVVDVKSFHMETPEDVAERVARCLESIPAERLSLVPDCGFFAVPRWVAAEKLKRLAAGAAPGPGGVRGRGGAPPPPRRVPRRPSRRPSMSTSRRRFLGGALATAGAAGLPAVARAQAKKNVPGEPVKIGVLAIRAGIAAPVGAAGLRGTAWWADRVNKAGGILGREVQLVTEEESNPKDTVERYRKLILQEKVDVVVGGISTAVTLALGPVAEEMGTPWLSWD